MKKLSKISLMSSLVFCSFSSVAQVTSNFNSNASLESRCAISAQNINFGTIDLINNNADINADGGFSILCSKGIAFTIEPSGGFNSGHTQIMKGTGSNQDGINVALRKNFGERVWSRLPNRIISDAGTGSEQLFPIYATILSTWGVKTHDASATNEFNYQARPDNYSVTVVATVTY